MIKPLPRYNTIVSAQLRQVQQGQMNQEFVFFLIVMDDTTDTFVLNLMLTM